MLCHFPSHEKDTMQCARESSYMAANANTYNLEAILDQQFDFRKNGVCSSFIPPPPPQAISKVWGTLLLSQSVNV